MPQLRDITVHITDADGNDLEEWGVQNLRGNRISAYIKSTTDMPFMVKLRPRIPYPDELRLREDLRRNIKKEAADGTYIKQEDTDNNTQDWTLRSPERSLDHLDSPQEKPPTYNRRNASSYHQNRRHRGGNEYVPPPFSFLATLYLDGRRKPERRMIVYLDPNDDDFTPPYGEIQFRYRTLQTRDGRLKEQSWVFKDIGIEAVFNRIALRDRTDLLEDPEDMLANAMDTSNLGDERTEIIEERRKVGQIVVELERVQLGKKYTDRNYRARHQEGEKDDVDMDDVDCDMAHKTAVRDLRTREHQSILSIAYEPYMRGEGPWATFQFFYRSHEQLQKFNFPNFPSSPQVVKKIPQVGRHLDSKLAMITPLSISYPLRTAQVSTRGSKRTFEERVKDGSAGFEDCEHRHEFHDYRDPADRRPSTTQEAVSNSKKVFVDTPFSIGTDSIPTKSSYGGRTPSTVLAIKEKARRPSKSSFAIGPRRSDRSSFSSPSPNDTPSSPGYEPSIQPPANSPTAGFYNPIADPRRKPPKGSQLDTFKTLSDASLALSKATPPGQLSPTSAVKDRNYRQLIYSSDTNDAEDERSNTTDDQEEFEDSDKENVKLNDGDDAGLHGRLREISLGAKRFRGEGMEELEEGEILEEDDEAKMKKRVPLGDRADTGPGILQSLMESEEGQAVLRAADGEADEDRFGKTMRE